MAALGRLHSKQCVIRQIRVVLMLIINDLQLLVQLAGYPVHLLTHNLHQVSDDALGRNVLL